MTGKSESQIVHEGFKNDGKFETPGKRGKADQRKKWSHKKPWPEAYLLILLTAHLQNVSLNKVFIYYKMIFSIIFLTSVLKTSYDDTCVY
ncbi:hypothetical protein evm_000504 [Chilo suppressalis]|nr:hypothetical protein evm_000504 [Chilo suppressalis]